MQKIWCGITGLFLLAGCVGFSHEGREVQPGDRLPAFVVEMEDGTSLAAAELQGLPSLILFFHTSCADCRQTIPVVQQAYELFGDDVRFVAISRAQTAEEVSAWWKQNGIGIPFSAQADRKVYELFASSRIPRIYISDREGIVQACFDDNPCPDYERLSGALTKVIAP